MGDWRWWLFIWLYAMWELCSTTRNDCWEVECWWLLLTLLGLVGTITGIYCFIDWEFTLIFWKLCCGLICDIDLCCRDADDLADRILAPPWLLLSSCLIMPLFPITGCGFKTNWTAFLTNLLSGTGTPCGLFTSPTLAPSLCILIWY